MKKVSAVACLCIAVLLSACATDYGVYRTKTGTNVASKQCYAVVPFENFTSSRQAGVIASQMLAAALQDRGNIDILFADETLRLAEVHKFNLGELPDAEALAKLRQDWGVDILVQGKVKEFVYTDDPELYADVSPQSSYSVQFWDTVSGAVLYEADVAASKGGKNTLSSVALDQANAIVANWYGLQSRTSISRPNCDFRLPGFTAGLVESVVEETAAPVAKIVPLSEEAQGLATQLRGQAKFMFRGLKFQLKEPVFVEGASAHLDRLIEVMVRYPALAVEFWIHTDNSAPEIENVALSRARGESIVRYLRDVGSIDPQRILVNAVGGRQPLLPNINRRNRMINRRVEIKMIRGPEGEW